MKSDVVYVGVSTRATSHIDYIVVYYKALGGPVINPTQPNPTEWTESQFSVGTASQSTPKTWRMAEPIGGFWSSQPLGIMPMD